MGVNIDKIMHINQVAIKQILNPTSIDLGEYVINPYKGCEYACLYCYVRHNKVIRNEKRKWGKYIDIRLNAPSQLEKELFIKKPKKVLLGSTTECFQPIEKEYRVTGRILEILNREGVYYSILTRSPIIKDYIGLLKAGYCENIYFTVNLYDSKLKRILEPKSSSFEERIEVVNYLLDERIPVIPYMSPVLPFVSKIDGIFNKFKKADRVDFEGLNFALGSVSRVIDAVVAVYPTLKEVYTEMLNGERQYNKVWQSIRSEIKKNAVRTKKNHSVYIHKLYSYFENKYR